MVKEKDVLTSGHLELHVSVGQSRAWVGFHSHGPTAQGASVPWSVSMALRGPDGGIIPARKPGLETQVSFSRVNSFNWIGLLVITPLIASISLPSLTVLKGGGGVLSPSLEKFEYERESKDM